MHDKRQKGERENKLQTNEMRVAVHTTYIIISQEESSTVWGALKVNNTSSLLTIIMYEWDVHTPETFW